MFKQSKSIERESRSVDACGEDEVESSKDWGLTPMGTRNIFIYFLGTSSQIHVFSSSLTATTFLLLPPTGFLWGWGGTNAEVEA